MLSGLLLVAPLLLAVVFAVAGLGKLLDRERSRRAIEAFGTRARLSSRRAPRAGARVGRRRSACAGAAGAVGHGRRAGFAGALWCGYRRPLHGVLRLEPGRRSSSSRASTGCPFRSTYSQRRGGPLRAERLCHLAILCLGPNSSVFARFWCERPAAYHNNCKFRAHSALPLRELGEGAMLQAKATLY
jgi:hypothetical protein